MVIKSMEVETLENCWVVLVASLAIPLHAFLCMTFHIIGPCWDLCIRSPRTRSFVCCACGDPGFEHIFCKCRQYLCLFRTPVECTPSRRGQGMMLVLPSQRLFQKSIFPHWIDVLLLSSRFCVVHTHRQDKSSFTAYKTSSPNLELFSQSSFNRTFSSGLFHHTIGPWFWPSASWWTHPKFPDILTFGNFQ